ncbi:MAG: DUF1080 domain-containing protein [Bryobacterales bacterium]|nr:DUF1080 domain-containing protein [Bryobacterales bacterium]
MKRRSLRTLALIGFFAVAGFAQQDAARPLSGKPPYRKAPTGYDKSPVLPGQQWRVHDGTRPHPRVVEPGTPSTAAQPGEPPSDAIVLFGGKDLSQWETEYRERRGQGQPRGPIEIRPASWTVADGYFEVVPGAGSLITKEKFGDVQLHLEFMTPTEPEGDSQWRANSGIIFMKRYEIQVLDSYNNPTYADGQAGAIYGQFPPLVNPVRKPGEWNFYDIVFEAPKFEGSKLVKPVHFTVFLNGVLLHNRQPAIGRMAHQVVGTYEPHDAEEPLMLQDHDVHVRFRNVWVRRLKGYDAR